MIASNISNTKLALNSIDNDLYRLAKLGRMAEGYFRASMDYNVAEEKGASPKELKRLDKKQEKLHFAILDLIFEDEDEMPPQGVSEKLPA